MEAKPLADETFAKDIFDYLSKNAEYTRALEDDYIHEGKADLLVFAADTKPLGILNGFLELADLKAVPYVFVSFRDHLGVACNNGVWTFGRVVVNVWRSDEVVFDNILEKVANLKMNGQKDDDDEDD
ncbi:hypothetical protein ACHQM5_015880 [Ranunculus cassubicifolius]